MPSLMSQYVSSSNSAKDLKTLHSSQCAQCTYYALQLGVGAFSSMLCVSVTCTMRALCTMQYRGGHGSRDAHISPKSRPRTADYRPPPPQNRDHPSYCQEVLSSWELRAWVLDWFPNPLAVRWDGDSDTCKFALILLTTHSNNDKFEWSKKEK